MVVSGGRWLESGRASGVLVRMGVPGGRGMGAGERLVMQVREPRVKARTPAGAGSQVIGVAGGNSVRRRWRARR
jgi:hypothetical protein